jgi:hypothetical protein
MFIPRRRFCFGGLYHNLLSGSMMWSLALEQRAARALFAARTYVLSIGRVVGRGQRLLRADRKLSLWKRWIPGGRRPVGPLARLGGVLGVVLLAVVLVPLVRQPAATNVTLPPEAAAAAAPPEIVGKNSNPPSVSPDLVATKMIVPPPPDTASALQDVDPRQLRASFQRGTAAMKLNYSEETTNEGARLVKIAAILGYGPARILIARDFPASAVIRSNVLPAEAVRFSLDPLFLQSARSEGNRSFLTLLASYFAGRHELQAYAVDLLAALRDDRRLWADDNLQSLLGQLARVHGACTVLAHAMVKARSVTGSECSSRLQIQIENFVRTNGPLGREAESRHEALWLLKKQEAAR